MPARPETLPEWQDYVDSLSGAPLRSKAKAANSIAFVRLMEEEGYGPKEISAILTMFGRRLVADGQDLPGRRYLDFGPYLAELDERHARTVALPTSAARALAPTCVVSVWGDGLAAWPPDGFDDAMDDLRQRLEQAPDEQLFDRLYAAATHAVDVPVDGDQLRLPAVLVERARLEEPIDVDWRDGVLRIRTEPAGA